MDILEGLNEKQIEAVTTTEGYVRVIAGAGSGKTRALASRFAYLVNDLGIMPGHILCVTFTNKSAREMAMRIHRLTGDNDTGYIIPRLLRLRPAGRQLCRFLSEEFPRHRQLRHR